MTIKVISVHYKTPELIYEQYKSVRQFYPEIPYEIIDGSDDNNNYFYDLENSDKNFVVKRFGYNIHHGPGMDHSLRNSTEDLILILDSDVTIKKELISEMLNNFTGIATGKRIIMNKDGYEMWQKKGEDKDNFKYPYIHPYCMLIYREKYLNFKPFIKHGSPCIGFMIDVFDKNKSNELVHFPIEEYVDLKIRGTRSKWGINL